MFQIGDLKLSGSTITAVVSLVAALSFIFNTYYDVKNQLNKIELHDKEFKDYEARVKRLECYNGLTVCDYYMPPVALMREESNSLNIMEDFNELSIENIEE